MSASFAGRKEERDRDRSSEGEAVVRVGFCFSLRDVLVIHDSEFYPGPLYLVLTPMHRSGAILLSPTLIDPDMQGPASELRRIPLLGRSVYKRRGRSTADRTSPGQTRPRIAQRGAAAEHGR